MTAPNQSSIGAATVAPQGELQGRYSPRRAPTGSTQTAAASGRLVPPTVSACAIRGRRWSSAFHWRFFLALLLGLVWIGPAWWDRRALYALPLWDGLVLVAWLTDLRRLPKPEELTVSRHWSEPVSLDIDSRVELRLENHGKRAVAVSIEDDVPAVLSPTLPKFTLSVPAGGLAVASYSVRPTTRGDIPLGRVFLRYHGAVMFAERWATVEAGQMIRVYPNLREPQRYTLYLIRSRQIELEKRLKRMVGRGREFESLREFRESDEIRDISWTATARRGKLISKVYQAERSQSVFLVVDAGRLMLAKTGVRSQESGVRSQTTEVRSQESQVRTRKPVEASSQSNVMSLESGILNVDSQAGFRKQPSTPAQPPAHLPTCPPADLPSWPPAQSASDRRTPPLTKLDYAVNAALTLAHVAQHSGDMTGLLTYGRNLQSYLPCARGAEHLRHFLDQLAMVSGEPVEADHALAADSLLARHRRRSLVVWITDLAETAATPDVIEAASRLLSRHLVLFAVVGEPELRALLARRPETPDQMYKYVAAQQVIQRRELLLRRMRERGALALEFTPDRLSPEIVNQYLQIKWKGLL